MSRLHDVSLDTTKMPLQELESFGDSLAVYQRGVNWWIGDAARHAKQLLGDDYTQVFPEWMSPGLIQRCEAVSAAYPREEDRNPLATWTVHMQHANKPDRVERVAASVGAGRTSDEERKAEQNGKNRPRWLLAVDVNYFVHRYWYSGAGVETAVSLTQWLQRTVERLKAKGLSDVACCMDSHRNHRKELTSDWEDKYKDRKKKEPELIQQLNLVRELLEGHGFPVVSVEEMEADDVMASFAKQFPGRVTLLTQDKDCRQCLSDKCNMLLDVEWTQDETSGEMLPDYKWLSAKQHTEETGIPPNRWTEFQALMGDACDGIKGAVGIGEKGAVDLVKEFGTAQAAIEAARNEDERIKPKKREALIEFEPKLETTKQLVTLRTDLSLPTSTRIPAESAA